jgi:allophanate hydrolase subunit 2
MTASVFPGTVQCSEDGQPFLLCVDAQTTGGYPRIAQVIRADRHMLGQLRPGDRVRLLRRDEQGAVDDLRAKISYWEVWLPGLSVVICQERNDGSNARFRACMNDGEEWWAR